MMAPTEILDRARELGITLAAQGDTITARPKGATPPELAQAIRAHKRELLAHLQRPLPPAGHPAYSILETCRAHGVALRIDQEGDLVVGSAGAKAGEPTQPWPLLLVALEANLEPVARLVESGWTLKASFPEEGALV